MQRTPPPWRRLTLPCTPLHKMGKVADMANAVRFLSCSEDSGFITGEIMNVCGGSLI